MEYAVQAFSFFALLGTIIGMGLFVIEDDVAEREADWFHDADKWIYRNPFA